MTRALFVLSGDLKRRQVIDLIMRAPVNTRVELKAPKRTLDQNSMMWSLLTDISQQLRWHGQKLTADDFKILLLAGLKQEMRAVPSIGGNGWVQLGRSSFDLSKDEMRDFIELILAFGAQHAVQFSGDPKAEKAA